MPSNNGAFKKSAAAQMNLINRETYKKVKNMDRIQLSGYLNRVWNDGFERGVKAASKAVTVPTPTKEGENAE